MEKIEYTLTNNNAHIPIPLNVTHLTVEGNFSNGLPPLPKCLEVLHCYDNQLQYLPPLPNSVEYLYCNDNQLQFLPPLPNSLINLYCHRNQLQYLPPLPKSLKELDCHGNSIVVCHPKNTWRLKRIDIHLDTQKMAKIYVYAATYLARQRALRVIKRNLHNWIDKPITNDGRLGITVRLGLRNACHQTTKWNPEKMWTIDPVSGKREYNVTDLDIESLYPSV
jgi:Leucine-rich repeat (LRR) protein